MNAETFLSCVVLVLVSIVVLEPAVTVPVAATFGLIAAANLASYRKRTRQ